MGYVHKRLYVIACYGLAAGLSVVNDSLAQPDSAPPFGRSSAPNEGSPASTVARARDLETRFRMVEEWSFFHSLDDLPDDMRIVLARAVASET
jgi:hypothetical protein